MSTYNAVILGGGLVGSVMARDLAADPDFNVTVVDNRPDVLDRLGQRLEIETRQADLADATQVKQAIASADIVLGALASVIGFDVLRTVIEAGKNYCDITFMPEDAIDLDDLARERGVTAVVDCGVAPGMSNMAVGYADAYFDSLTNVEIYVGGLPNVRSWPYEYKAGFSPYDVIQEYLRPSRIVVNGDMVTREALSEPELMDFHPVGTLEAFNTDGLRSLATTIDCPNMKEKTLRYPGHIELMRAFRHTGLFSEDEIEVGKDRVKIRPIDVMSALLFPKWTYEEGEVDLTVMRIIVDGVKDGHASRRTWDLIDYADVERRETSMSRTTAFPNTIMARKVARGEFARPGVNPPEFIGRQDGMLDSVIAELETRGVDFVETSAVD